MIQITKITEANVEQMYDKAFQTWLFDNSDEVFHGVNKEPIPKEMRFWMRMPKENGESNIELPVEMSCMKNGIQLREETFIKQEIYRCEQIHTLPKIEGNWHKIETSRIYLQQLQRRLNSIQEEPTQKVNTSTVTEQKPLELIDFFKESSLYIKVIGILADAGYYDRNSRIWKDRSNGNKETFAALMKDLYFKGYLKSDFSKDGSELKEIARNTFNLSISQTTARKASHDKLDTNLKELIPYACTLPELPKLPLAE